MMDSSKPLHTIAVPAMSQRVLMLANCDPVRDGATARASNLFAQRFQTGLILSGRVGLTGNTLLDNDWLSAVLTHNAAQMQDRQRRLIVYGLEEAADLATQLERRDDGFIMSSENGLTIAELKQSGAFDRVRRRVENLGAQLDGPLRPLVEYRAAQPDVRIRYRRIALDLLDARIRARARELPQARQDALRGLYDDLDGDGFFSRSQAYRRLGAAGLPPGLARELQRTVFDLAYVRQFETAGDEVRLQDFDAALPAALLIQTSAGFDLFRKAVEHPSVAEAVMDAGLGVCADLIGAAADRNLASELMHLGGQGFLELLQQMKPLVESSGLRQAALSDWRGFLKRRRTTFAIEVDPPDLGLTEERRAPETPRTPTGFSTPYFRVLEDRGWYAIEETNGSKGAALLAFDEAGRVILVSVHRPALSRLSVEIPRGYARDGESPDACAMREFQEETGLVLSPRAGRLQALGHVAPNGGLLTTTINLFVWTATRPMRRAATGDGEVRDLVRLDATQLKDAIRSGLICDAVTLSALARHGAA